MSKEEQSSQDPFLIRNSIEDHDFAQNLRANSIEDNDFAHPLPSHPVEDNEFAHFLLRLSDLIEDKDFTQFLARADSIEGDDFAQFLAHEVARLRTTGTEKNDFTQFLTHEAERLRASRIDNNDFAQFLAREALRESLQESLRNVHDPATIEGVPEPQMLERLGRQRPEQLTAWGEIGFVFSIIMSQALNEIFLSGFTILIPPVIEALDIPPQSVTWPTNSFTIVIAAFLIPFGRLADMYGGYVVYIGGMAWLTLMALVISFSRNEIMLNVCRALQGLGSAAYLPAGLTLLGNMYRPGPRKNIIFSIYGSIAALGFYIGMVFAGLVGQYTAWPAFFWIGTGLSFLTTVVAYFTIPNDTKTHSENGVKMDWLGSATISSGLILFVFAITQASYAPQGWRTPYIYVTLTFSILIFGAAFYIEGWVAEQPLLPFSFFKIPNVRPLIIGLLFSYSTLGLFLFYCTLYTRYYMGAGPLLQVAWFTPMGIGGAFIAIFGGLFLHKMPMKLVTLISSLATIADSLLFALIPDGANYWAWVFPAMWCSTIAIDLMFSAVSIFFSTSVPSHQQGIAGAVSNAILQLAITLGLGFADVVVSETMPAQGRRQAYHNAFWLELALGACSLVVFMVFVRIEPAKADYTADEKESIRLSMASAPPSVIEARSVVGAPSIMPAPSIMELERTHTHEKYVG